MKKILQELKNIFIQIVRMFRVKRNELLPALVNLAVYLVLNVVLVCRYADQFMTPAKNYWALFVNNFRLSGFDPITYSVVSEWSPQYNIYRHPLLAFFVYPLYLLDSSLMQLTGVNLVQYVIAAVLLFITFYSFIFVMRICRDVIGVKNTDAILLASMLFSFGFVMVSYIAPDHFAPSMFMLLMALYVCGVKIRDHKRLDGWQTMLMFMFTAGITLSNGVKVFIYALFVDGKRFFRPKYLFCAVVVPAALIWGFARWEYYYYQYPKAKARFEARKKASDQKRAKDFAMFRDTTAIKDTTEVRKAFDQLMNKRIREKYIADHKQPGNAHKGKPIANGEFSSWTDISTPRWDSVVENMFGESIILHADHLLGDTLRGRPVLVYYYNPFIYALEALIVLMFAAGVWFGRRSRFLWMMLGGFCVEIGIHIVLGFGLNEVYIMGCHWLFVIPIAMAYMLKSLTGRRLLAMRLLTGAVTAFLLVYNLSLILPYIIG